MLDITKVTSRLEPDLDENELADANEAMLTLEDQARYLMRVGETVILPRLVQGIIYNACVRYMRNYLGLTVSRAGDETLGWDGIGDKAGSPYFTEDEEEMIENAKVRRPSLHFANVTAHGLKRKSGNTVYVPVADGSKPFPWREEGEP